MGRFHVHLKREGRRLLAAALAFCALGLFAAATAVALDDRRAKRAGHLEEAQLARVLPVPRAPSAPSTRRPSRAAWRYLDRHVPRPVGISIPAIGVSAPIIALDLNPDRTLQVPSSFSVAGWFRGAAEPGEPGPAIVVGHVDSHNGPGVFYRLRALRRGDRIAVKARNGAVIRYTVTSALAAPKDRFPTRVVYGKTRRPTLRLITCGGVFNSATGHYVDNYIVFAEWAGTRHPERDTGGRNEPIPVREDSSFMVHEAS